MARNRWKFLVALMMVLALVAAACSSDDDASSDTTAASTDETTTTAAGEPAEAFKVAFVHVGPTADKGWSWAHDQGAQYLKANMPGVEITTLESIPETATC
jgi:basic membrane protein A